MRTFNISAEELRRLYWDERKSARQIGEMFGFCQVTVLKKMWKFGIPRRTDSEALSGDLNPMFGVHRCGKDHPMYGRHQTEESKNKNRRWHLGKRLSEETKAKISKALKGRKFSAEHKRAVVEAITRWNKENPAVGERNPFYGKHHSLETRKLLSEQAKKRWRNPDYRNSIVRKIMKAWHVKPNKKEKFLINLINEHDLPFRYVGDGQFILGGRCPDFLNYNGKKQLIELFGDYFHRDDDPQERIDFFRQYGFETLVIWEHKLDNPSEVVVKIKAMME